MEKDRNQGTTKTSRSPKSSIYSPYAPPKKKEKKQDGTAKAAPIEGNPNLPVNPKRSGTDSTDSHVETQLTSKRQTTNPNTAAANSDIVDSNNDPASNSPSPTAKDDTITTSYIPTTIPLTTYLMEKTHILPYEGLFGKGKRYAHDDIHHLLMTAVKIQQGTYSIDTVDVRKNGLPLNVLIATLCKLIRKDYDAELLGVNDTRALLTITRLAFTDPKELFPDPPFWVGNLLKNTTEARIWRATIVNIGSHYTNKTFFSPTTKPLTHYTLTQHTLRGNWKNRFPITSPVQKTVTNPTGWLIHPPSITLTSQDPTLATATAPKPVSTPPPHASNSNDITPEESQAPSPGPPESQILPTPPPAHVPPPAPTPAPATHMEGLAAPHWLLAQQRYYRRIGSKHTGNRWLLALLKLLNNMAWDQWEHRNA